MEKRKSILRDKSFGFALRAIKCYQYLQSDKKEFLLSKQLLRSATSIGANIREGEQAQSKTDFIHKLSIALKEASETAYWLELLHQSGYLPESVYQSIYEDCIELIKLLTSIIKQPNQPNNYQLSIINYQFIKVNNILGLHHITAIANNAKRNHDFYTKVLGLRMVKKTVNFDDPGTYHFYFGDENGTPGSILTFFPWEGIGQGRNGTGMATDIGYSVPPGSLEFWKDRFKEFNVRQQPVNERFGEQFLSFQDPDGLQIDLIVPEKEDKRKPWTTEEVKENAATKGFYNVTLTLKTIKGTAEILTDVFGYEQLKQEGNRYRFTTGAIEGAAVIDLLEAPGMPAGHNAAGTNHHIAFRVKDENIQMKVREKIAGRDLNPTSKIDRDYFYSVYFREPGGVLFELATENPGFTVDEPLTELGSHLKLPKQFEPARKQIEKVLPAI
jgi:glyoxalase family protein